MRSFIKFCIPLISVSLFAFGCLTSFLPVSATDEQDVYDQYVQDTFVNIGTTALGIAGTPQLAAVHLAINEIRSQGIHAGGSSSVRAEDITVMGGLYSMATSPTDIKFGTLIGYQNGAEFARGDGGLCVAVAPDFVVNLNLVGLSSAPSGAFTPSKTKISSSYQALNRIIYTNFNFSEAGNYAYGRITVDAGILGNNVMIRPDYINTTIQFRATQNIRFALLQPDNIEAYFNVGAGDRYIFGSSDFPDFQPFQLPAGDLDINNPIPYIVDSLQPWFEENYPDTVPLFFTPPAEEETTDPTAELLPPIEYPDLPFQTMPSYDFELSLPEKALASARFWFKYFGMFVERFHFVELVVTCLLIGFLFWLIL